MHNHGCNRGRCCSKFFFATQEVDHGAWLIYFPLKHQIKRAVPKINKRKAHTPHTHTHVCMLFKRTRKGNGFFVSDLSTRRFVHYLLVFKGLLVMCILDTVYLIYLSSIMSLLHHFVFYSFDVLLALFVFLSLCPVVPAFLPSFLSSFLLSLLACLLVCLLACLLACLLLYLFICLFIHGLCVFFLYFSFFFPS